MTDHNHDNSHDHRHEHGNEHDTTHEHSHNRGDDSIRGRKARSNAPRVRLKAKDAPGVIYIERNIHDEAIVVSGTLTVITANTSFNSVIAKEFETAARDISELGGVVGHIKATSAVTMTSMISVTDEKAMVKESPECKVKLTLAAIVFLVDPEAASDIMRQTLARVRSSSRD